jgi:hypothetical protein
MKIIYLVTVYCDDGRTEAYHFDDIDHVLASFRTTWGKISHSIVKPTPQQWQVRGGNGELLAYCRPASVLNGPTHF